MDGRIGPETGVDLFCDAHLRFVNRCGTNELLQSKGQPDSDVSNDARSPSLFSLDSVGEVPARETQKEWKREGPNR
jgi:hypothetical protein